jgi:hypothetical protein
MCGGCTKLTAVLPVQLPEHNLRVTWGLFLTVILLKKTQNALASSWLLLILVLL